MKKAYPVERIRAAEAALMATLPPGTLMQRAAFGLAGACADFLGGVYGSRIVLLVGSGDNGGDALFAGAFLARRGALVSAVLLSPERAHADGVQALLAAGGRTFVSSYEKNIAEADLVIDGIVGIGGKPGLRENALHVLELVHAHGVSIVAVDVPSGVDVDSGEAKAHHVKADLTVTFGAYKICQLVDPGADACGAVEFVDIGLSPYLEGDPVTALQRDDVAELLPVPGRFDHKYTRGVLGVVAGSEEYPGAAVLAVGGALHGFTGMVRYVGPRKPSEVVRAAWPEVVAGEGKVQAWVVGPGLGDASADLRDLIGLGDDDMRAIELRELLAQDVPMLIDADGLRLLPEIVAEDESPYSAGQLLLTPHEGELARMLGVERDEVAERRLHFARLAAERLSATVLLKGAAAVIAAPDGEVRVNTVGTPWVATAGSGDVLSGLCGSLLASGLSPLDAASVGCFLHETAGLIASDGGPITASDIVRALPEAIRSVRDPLD